MNLNNIDLSAILTNAALISFAIYVAYVMNRAGIRKIISAIRNFEDVREALESEIADVVSGILPYLSAVIPSYYSYHHLIYLKVHPFFAFLFALVVEGLAFANINTLMQFRNYNETKAQQFKKYDKASTWPIWFNLALYLLVVISVNGLVSFLQEVEESGAVEEFVSLVINFDLRQIAVIYFSALIKVIVVTLMSLLTIPGAMTVAVRMQHKRYLEEKTSPRKVVVHEDGAVQDTSQQKVEQGPPAVHLTKKQKAFAEMLRANRTALKNKASAAEKIGVSRPTLDKYISLFLEAGHIRLNEHNVVTYIKDGI